MTDVYERCEKCKQFHIESIPCFVKPETKQAINYTPTEQDLAEDELDTHLNNCISCQIALYDLVSNHIGRMKK